MKNIVLKDDFREYEIRPQDEFDRYLELIAEDVEKIFGSEAGKYFYYCPACEHKESKVAFSKGRFIYRECSNCETIYLSPRPTREMLHEFFDKSEGLKYWNSKVIQETSSRVTHVFNPRVRWVLQSADIQGVSSENYCDIYTKYVPYVDRLREDGNFSESFSYRPNREISQKLEDGSYKIINSREDIEKGSISVITAFEVFDRFYNPNTMMDFIDHALKKDGLLFLTTLSASGLDLQILKEKSRSLIPPLHLNIFSVEGMIEFLKRHNYEIIELSTPGVLDTSIISNAAKTQTDLELPKFLRDISNRRDDNIKQAFQEFLQRAMLSSHLRIVAKKIKE